MMQFEFNMNLTLSVLSFFKQSREFVLFQHRVMLRNFIVEQKIILNNNSCKGYLKV